MSICSAPQKDFSIFISDGVEDVQVPFNVEQDIKAVFCDTFIDTKICTDILFPVISAQFFTGVGVGNSLVLHVEKQPNIAPGIGVGGVFVLKKDHLRQASAGISLGSQVTVKVGSKDVVASLGISPKVDTLISHGIIDISLSSGVGSGFQKLCNIYVLAYLSDVNDMNIQDAYDQTLQDFYYKEKY